MRSSNPVFTRRGFSRDGGYAGFNAPPQAGGPAVAQGGNPYAQPGTNPYAPADQGRQAPPTTPVGGRMTMDDVVARTGMTLGLLVITAIGSWIAFDGEKSLGIGLMAALVAMGLALVQAFKRKPVPALILSYAALEGVFLGIISEYFNTYVGNSIVMQAVLGTMAVFAGVLVAYKTRLIRVNARFQRFVVGAAIGFILLMAVNLLFAVIGGGDGLGLRTGGLGILFGVIGIVLGACFLALDFKQVEDGITYGAPRSESWLAAFGLTLTLVWIYLEMLRLLSILQGND